MISRLYGTRPLALNDLIKIFILQGMTSLKERSSVKKIFCKNKAAYFVYND